MGSLRRNLCKEFGREAYALAKLPEDEQKACRALWAEVDELEKKARAQRP
jgi:hypothetical protein